MKTQTAEVMKRYRDEKRLSQTEFAEALNVVPGASFVRQNVSQWENGEFLPNYWFMYALHHENVGWQSDMALEVLRVMKPELYGGEE